MKRWRWRLITLGSVALFAAFAAFVAWPSAPTGLVPADAARVQVGMTWEEVCEALGEPPARDAIRSGDDPNFAMGMWHIPGPPDRVSVWNADPEYIVVYFAAGRVVRVAVTTTYQREPIWERAARRVRDSF
jgi:hypothetical protein